MTETYRSCGTCKIRLRAIYGEIETCIICQAKTPEQRAEIVRARRRIVDLIHAPLDLKPSGSRQRFV